MKSYFEKSNYMPGDVAVVISEVNAGKSKADIKSINGYFKQTLILGSKKGFGANKIINRNLATVELHGIKAGEAKMGEQALRHQIHLMDESGHPVQPTSLGNLIKNSYVLNIESKMDICRCCHESPVSQLNVTVHNTPPVATPWIPPPAQQWKPKIMTVYVGKIDKYYPPEPEPVKGSSTNNMKELEDLEPLKQSSQVKLGYSKMD